MVPSIQKAVGNKPIKSPDRGNPKEDESHEWGVDNCRGELLLN